MSEEKQWLLPVYAYDLLREEFVHNKGVRNVMRSWQEFVDIRDDDNKMNMIGWCTICPALIPCFHC